MTSFRSSRSTEPGYLVPLSRSNAPFAKTGYRPRHPWSLSLPAVAICECGASSAKEWRNSSRNDIEKLFNRSGLSTTSALSMVVSSSLR